MKTEHTPLPWHKRKALKPVDGVFDYAISAQSASVLAETFGRDSKGLFLNAEANAELIVRAVNSYEPMKEALESALSLISKESGWGTYPRMEGSQLYIEAGLFKDKARAAIKLAKGE